MTHIIEDDSQQDIAPSDQNNQAATVLRGAELPAGGIQDQNALSTEIVALDNTQGGSFQARVRPPTNIQPSGASTRYTFGQSGGFSYQAR